MGDTPKFPERVSQKVGYFTPMVIRIVRERGPDEVEMSPTTGVDEESPRPTRP